MASYLEMPRGSKPCVPDGPWANGVEGLKTTVLTMVLSSKP